MKRKPLNHYKAIFFDAGDTLIFLPSASEKMHQYFTKRSLPCEVDQITGLFTEILREQYYDVGHSDFSACTPESDRRFWVQMYAALLEKLGAHHLWNEQQIIHCCDELYHLFTSPPVYELFDDVKPCLDLLKAMAMPMGLISNFAPSLLDILASKEILPYFQTVIVSTLVGVEKPNPAIFQLAVQQSGFAAADILYIGDHDLNDIWAPQQIGMNAIKIKRYEYHTGKGISTLLELFT